MDGARNLLLSTCKERNLRRKDPNVADENLSFTMTTGDYKITPGDGGWWKANNSTRPDAIFTLGDGRYTTSRTDGYTFIRPAQYNVPGTRGVMHYDHTDPNGELYLRLIVSHPMNGYMNRENVNIFAIYDQTSGQSSISIDSLSSAGDKMDWGFTVNWIDPSGEPHSMTTGVFSRGYDGHTFDIKVFIPEIGTGGKPKLVVNQIFFNNIITVEYPEDTGYYDTGGIKTMGLWSSPDGLEYNDAPTITYSRIGIGNDITTALP